MILCIAKAPYRAGQQKVQLEYDGVWQNVQHKLAAHGDKRQARKTDKNRGRDRGAGDGGSLMRPGFHVGGAHGRAGGRGTALL